MYRKIIIGDTSIASNNVGDEIIMDAVNEQLNSIFFDERLIKIPTHEIIGKSSLSLIRNSNLFFLGGSNILSSRMNKYKQWNINLLQALLINQKTLLLGVGWRNYQSEPNLYSKLFLKYTLSDNYFHSVRDSYTEKFLLNLGHKNVYNTGCPTMWKLTPDHCSQIPLKKSSSVIFTLTDYNKNKNLDEKLINSLFNVYSNIYFWVQGGKDFVYLKSLDIPNSNEIRIIGPNLNSFDNFLINNDCDYVGTRLHGGIRAIQFKKRTLIIGIDNRALEKKKDFNLNVIERTEDMDLINVLNNDIQTKLDIPFDKINLWKNQF